MWLQVRLSEVCLFLQAMFTLACCFSDMESGPIATSGSVQPNGDRFKIEGRAIVPGVKTQDWISSARVTVEGEEYIGFLRTDGSFVVNDVPSGSYVVEVISPGYKFEAVRVDITSKGKMRARLVNFIKTSEVIRQPYPLQLRSSGPHTYFMKRETWGWTDFLMNPMVMMMVLPLLIIVLLPKVVNTNDPEMRKEMEQSMNMLNPNPELPDVSEFMTKLFSGSKSSSSKAGQDEGNRMDEDEDEGTEVFTKRKLESNWDRYKESEKDGPSDDTPTQRGTDYHVLLESAGKEYMTCSFEMA
uniref:Endoplasmic reticulum membrane protein complex subunit 7 n=1 Tax=Hucho hucho TaxID=62062 RepID=A0A4W5R7T4_9TELE